MDIEWVRRYCMGLPHTTETVQWGANLVFKIAGKIYAMAELEDADHWVSFKCSPEDFAELCEREGIVPAPYLARAQWVTLQTEDAVGRPELKRLLRNAYDLVFAKLPRKTQAALKVVTRTFYFFISPCFNRLRGNRHATPPCRGILDVHHGNRRSTACAAEFSAWSRPILARGAP